jgi:hypothetical protein
VVLKPASSSMFTAPLLTERERGRERARERERERGGEGGRGRERATCKLHVSASCLRAVDFLFLVSGFRVLGVGLGT